MADGRYTPPGLDTVQDALLTNAATAAALAVVDAETDKIDGATTDGLLGAHDSVAYRAGEIERHLHHRERWMQLATTQTATHKGVALGDTDGAGPYVMDAGDSSVTPTWGTWIQILGADDTPAESATNVYMDPHLIMVTATERNATYFLQIGFGATGAAALLAGTYTETVFQPASNQIDSAPVSISTRRVATGSLMWCRVLCPANNTATLSAYFGGHEDEG